jgi:hypothetical protein
MCTEGVSKIEQESAAGERIITVPRTMRARLFGQQFVPIDVARLLWAALGNDSAPRQPFAEIRRQIKQDPRLRLA